MGTSPHTIRLAGEDLGDHRHVCALLDRPDDVYELLMPFIVEGFEQGDRAYHVVDPDTREAHLEALQAHGIDVGAATSSRQLEVRTWAETYLRDGRFDRRAQTAFVRSMLIDGPGLGFPVTRAIGSMEWADDVTSRTDLVAYELRLTELLRRPPDVVICTYDLNRHSARTIADIIGAHSAALVGGVLRANAGPPPLPARERLLAAASQLFQEAGIQATGVDSIIREAGVAKATFYRHFPSKDDLVVAWLRDTRTRWFDDVRAAVEARGGSPIDRIQWFFEGVGSWLEEGGYRGCPYLNTASELTEPTHPAQPVIRAYLQEIEDYLEGLVAAASYRDSRTLAATLQTLVSGSISLGVARRSGVAILSARDTAMSLLAAAERD